METIDRKAASAAAGGEEIPSADELVARARALVPMLRERADAIEEARRVDEEVIDAFRKAGFFRIM
ncbi:MAG: flavin-dependent monooxygenase, partial [Burkholderiaceae bacterium]|nr:flavin-dependent monooxygenase [Burkholderiaceae bacterium]